MSDARSGGLYVGPLVVESGIGMLVEALDLFPGSRVDVIGVGPERSRIEASPIDDVLHYLMSGGRAVGGLKAAMKRAGDFAAETWPEWPWRPQVIGALTLAYLLGAVARFAQGPRSYGKLIENRSAWMPA